MGRGGTRPYQVQGRKARRSVARRRGPPNAAGGCATASAVHFRNRIIHGYDSVDDVIVWRTVQHHLPMLKAEVESLLGQD